MVAAATSNLCEAANASVQGHASEEKLISSAKQVAASTAQLLVACKVKADHNSEAMRRLQVTQKLNFTAAVWRNSVRYNFFNMFLYFPPRLLATLWSELQTIWSKQLRKQLLTRRRMTAFWWRPDLLEALLRWRINPCEGCNTSAFPQFGLPFLAERYWVFVFLADMLKCHCCLSEFVMSSCR